MEPHLSLSSPRASHAMAKMGSCLVVAGGHTPDAFFGTTSVEVLDIQWGIVWSLPNLTIPQQYGCSMVTLSDCLLVLGGEDSEDCVESLALTVDRIPSTTPGAEPPRDARDSGSARSHSTHLETSSSNRP